MTDGECSRNSKQNSYIVPSIVLPTVSVTLGKVFKISSDFDLADFALKWTMYVHKIRPSVSALEALVW